MKIHKKPSLYSLALSALIGVASLVKVNAATVTWDNGGSGDAWSNAQNWSGDALPVSGVDSIVINNVGNWVSFNTNFTIGNGQSLTSTATGDYRIRANGGILTVATGGTLNFTGGSGIDGIEDAFANGMHLVIESGAAAAVDRLDINRDITGDPNETVSFVASTIGVTTFDVTNQLEIANSTLNLDLSTLSSFAGTYELFDYGSITGTFADINVYSSGGLGGVELSDTLYTIDYAYDLGGGDLGVALTVIPEPSAFLLLASGSVLSLFRRKR